MAIFYPVNRTLPKYTTPKVPFPAMPYIAYLCCILLDVRAVGVVVPAVDA